MSWSCLIFALVVYSASVDGKAIQGEYELYAQVNGWLKLYWGPMTWRNARLTCFNEGGVLASPENEALMAAMTEIISSDHRLSHVFTGIHDTFSTGLFYSLEGTNLTEMPASWAPGRPDSGNTESCLSMRHDGMLMDSKCSDELPFICYKKKVPPPSFPGCGPADNGYSYYGTTNSCYKFHAEDKYWRDAFAACAEEDAHLAIINSDKEAEVLMKLFSDNFNGRLNNEVRDVAHIGFVDWGKKGGQWMTIHGQTLEEAGYARWHIGEPNNITDQFCGGLNVEGGLDDVNCYNGDPHGVTRSFICEKKPTYTGEPIVNAYLTKESSSDESNELALDFFKLR